MIKFILQKIFPVIIIASIAFFIPGALEAADLNNDLFARLNPGTSLPDISPMNILINKPGPAAGSFLVATQRLNGSFFSQAVIFLIHNGNQGSTGLVINRPSLVKLSAAFPDEKEIQTNDDVMYTGGPVEMASLLILIRSDSEPPESRRIMDNLYITSSIKTLHQVYNRSGSDKDLRVFHGYAGWSPGQLSAEVAGGSWHVMSGDTGIVFDKNPEGLWEEFIKRKAEGKGHQVDN